QGRADRDDLRRTGNCRAGRWRHMANWAGVGRLVKYGDDAWLGRGHGYLRLGSAAAQADQSPGPARSSHRAAWSLSPSFRNAQDNQPIDARSPLSAAIARTKKVRADA